MASPVEILRTDYSNAAHRYAIPHLLNIYAQDLLGFRSGIDNNILQALVPGLEKTPNNLVLLARVDNSYVGMAICFFSFSTFHAMPLINIHDFMVCPEYRGRGIGKALLDEIERIAREKGCCKITLEVQENNTAARRLYGNFGFTDSFLDPEAGSQLFMTKACHRD